MQTRWLETTLRSGDAIEHGAYTVTPQSWTLTASWPGGGWVWNRPSSVLVESALAEKEGSPYRLPIHNVTLRAQIAFSTLALIGVLVLAIVVRTGAPRSN